MDKALVGFDILSSPKNPFFENDREAILRIHKSNPAMFVEVLKTIKPQISLI